MSPYNFNKNTTNNNINNNNANKMYAKQDMLYCIIEKIGLQTVLQDDLEDFVEK